MLDINNTETLEIYVLGDDFKFYQNLKYLPLTSYPSNIQSALIVYSLRGKAKLTVHEDVHLDTAEGTDNTVARTVCLI